MANKEKNMKKSLEVQEVLEEIKDMLEDVVNPIDTVVEVPEDTLEKKYTGCGCETCKAKDVACKDCPKCSEEEMSKNYESDNPDEDKWDNIAKACWSGYKQVGMKDKNGRKVPNCVPVNKSYHADEKPKKEIKKSIWDGAFLK